jgi:hypothetical protein
MSAPLIPGSALPAIDPRDLSRVAAWGADPTGALDSAMQIQACIDYAVYTGGTRVILDAGTYKISDTLHLGYGETFHSVVLEGDGYMYRGEAGFNGSCIKPTFSDRPAVNVQGARGSVIRGISIYGLLYSWIGGNDLAGAAPLLDDTDPGSWDDPGLTPTLDSRYCPYAAITIDAYSGSRPATSYPDVNYPAALGSVAQYGKAYSSDVLIEDVQITGFTVGIANQPCDADGNGDFTLIRRVNMDSCKWGISVGNTQSRNVAVENVKLGTVYSALTNTTHGRRLGKFDGAITNLSMGASIQVFEFNTSAYAGPIGFQNFYGEAMWRIGRLVAATGNETSIRFKQSLISFDNQTETRGIPATILDGGQQSIDLVFEGTTLSNFPSVVAIAQQCVIFDGLQVMPSERNGAGTPKPYLRHAHNLLCAGVVLPRLATGGFAHRVKFKSLDLDTGSWAQNPMTGPGYRYGARNYCIPLYVRELQAHGDTWQDDLLSPQSTGTPFDKSARFSCVTLADRVLTLTFTSLPDWAASLYGPLPGDVLWDDETGTVFFVRSRNQTTVVAEQQNNYRSDGAGGYETIDAFSTSTGHFYCANSRIYTPTQPLFGDTTSGSAAISNCGRDDGYAGFIDADLVVGDRLFINDRRDRFYGPDVNRLTARSSADKSITIESTALRSLSRKRLGFFIRQAPANESSR